MKNNSINTIKKVIPFIINIILVLIVINIIVSGFIEDKQGEAKANLIGFRPVVVVSGSMLPDIQINSISIMKYCSIDDLEVGDIVLYKHPNLGINITHRVIEVGKNEIGKQYIRTKGDANKGPDNIDITDDMVVGKLTTTFNEVAPYVSLVMHNNGEINTVALVPVLLVVATTLTVIGMLLYTVWLTLKSAFIVLFKQNKIQEITEVYSGNNREQFNNLHLFNKARHVKFDTLQMFIAKILLIKDAKTFEEASINIQKSQNRLKKLLDSQDTNNENSSKN